MAVRSKASPLIAVLWYLIEPVYATAKLTLEWIVILLFYATLPLTRYLCSRYLIVTYPPVSMMLHDIPFSS